MSLMKGKLITFEGGEGCGKSMQSELLNNYLQSKGYNVFKTREPGGNSFSEEIRNLVQNPKYKGQVEDLAELFLYEAARVQFVARIIKQKINEGYVVVSDRYYDATTAYQGYGDGIDLKTIQFLNEIASQGIKPDITFIIDIHAELGLKRMQTKEFGKADRMEQKGLEYHKRVNQGFLEIAKAENERVKVIQYQENKPEEMHKEIINYVNELLDIK